MEKKIQLSVNIPMNVWVTQEEFDGPNRTFILLHGYGETKERIKRKLFDSVKPFGNQVIAINAPFPIPQFTESGPKEAYSWFFRSHSLGITLVAPSANEPLFAKVCSELQLRDKKCVLVGFSQGGMILPILARQLQSIEAMIAISAGIREADYGVLPQVPIHIIHGKADSQSDLAFVKKEYEQLKKRQPASYLHEVDGAHNIDEIKLAALRHILSRL